MDNKSPLGLILLTYKGKVLLMNENNGPMDTQKHAWTFIEGKCEGNGSLEKTLIKQVERKMGIKIDNAQHLSESYYHATLTDDNVNSIERSDNQLLDFFNPRELDSLLLSPSTSQFIQKHGELI